MLLRGTSKVYCNVHPKWCWSLISLSSCLVSSRIHRDQLAESLGVGALLTGGGIESLGLQKELQGTSQHLVAPGC